MLFDPVCKKKKKKKKREKSVYLIISFERTRFFLFLPDCLRCQALDVGSRSGHDR